MVRNTYVHAIRTKFTDYHSYNTKLQRLISHYLPYHTYTHTYLRYTQATKIDQI